MTATELTARKYDLLARINALPESDPRLDDVAGVLSGDKPSRPDSLRMLTVAQAARETGISRWTISRNAKDGMLRLVEIRPGIFRVTENELRRWMRAR